MTHPYRHNFRNFRTCVSRMSVLLPILPKMILHLYLRQRRVGRAGRGRPNEFASRHQEETLRFQAWGSRGKLRLREGEAKETEEQAVRAVAKRRLRPFPALGFPVRSVRNRVRASFRCFTYTVLLLSSPYILGLYLSGKCQSCMQSTLARRATALSLTGCRSSLPIRLVSVPDHILCTLCVNL